MTPRSARPVPAGRVGGIRGGVVVVGVQMILAAMLLGACAADRADRADRAATTDQRSTTTVAGTPTTVAETRSSCQRSDRGRGGGIVDHAVGRADRTVVDTSRATVAPPSSADRAAPTRSLPLVVLYPARGRGDTGGGAVEAAEPSTDGPFPLLVHSHGLGGWGDERIEMLTRWASAGYVVVAPTFPLSSRSTDPSDLANQPADVAFVVQRIRAATDDSSDLLHGLVRGDCVALSGHSLGGGTAMTAAYDTCCSTIHPTAVIDIAGVLAERTAGARLADMAPIPALLVHGDADQRVPYSQSETKVQLLHGPTWLLTFTGGGHSDMFTPPRSAVLDDAVVSFLDAQMQGAPRRLEELGGVVESSGLAELRYVPRR